MSDILSISIALVINAFLISGLFGRLNRIIVAVERTANAMEQKSAPAPLAGSTTRAA